VAKIEAAFFDLGGVVMASGSPRELLEVYEGADLATLTVLFLGPDDDGDHPWHRAERGEISIVEAWPLIQELMTEHGVTRRPDHTPAPSTQEWRVNEPVVEVLTELRAEGVRTSIITNNIAEFRSRWWDVLPFAELFDDIVDSHEVGMRKPSPAIYELAMRRVGLADASKGVFLDDVMRNVEGARAVGMHGIWVDEDPQAAVDELRLFAFG
jgi:epoxide hydrolase-like predicted phosphatase